MRHIKIITLVALLYVFFPSSVRAWNKAGHMLTGAVAYARFYIRVRPDSPTVHLHRFCDGLTQDSERFASVQNRSGSFRARQATDVMHTKGAESLDLATLI